MGHRRRLRRVRLVLPPLTHREPIINTDAFVYGNCDAYTVGYADTFVYPITVGYADTFVYPITVGYADTFVYPLQYTYTVDKPDPRVGPAPRPDAG